VLKRRGAELPHPVIVDVAKDAARDGPRAPWIDGTGESPREAGTRPLRRAPATH